MKTVKRSIIIRIIHELQDVLDAGKNTEFNIERYNSELVITPLPIPKIIPLEDQS